MGVECLGWLCLASKIELVIYRLPFCSIGRPYLPSLEKGD